MSTDGGPHFDRDPLRQRLGRRLILFAPPAVTVGALLGVAVVSPNIGFLLLLVASSLAGLVLSAFHGGGATYEGVESSYFVGNDVDSSSAEITVPDAATFFTAYLYGIIGFGLLGCLFTGIFLI